MTTRVVPAYRDSSRANHKKHDFRVDPRPYRWTSLLDCSQHFRLEGEKEQQGYKAQGG